MEIAISVGDLKSWSDVAANLAQVAAIGIGGWWTYTRFIRQREEWPRVNLEQLITHRDLDRGLALLRVSVGLENSGSVLVEVDEIRVYLFQVLPIDDPSTRNALGEGRLIEDGKFEADWPCLEQYEQKLDPTENRIEPGEGDQFGFDFVVPRSIKTVFVYCYVRNLKQRKREIGWQLTQFYELHKHAGDAAERVDALTGKSATR